MKEALYTFSFPYDIDIMVPWRESPERYRKIQRRGKRQQSESWPRVRFRDRKMKGYVQKRLHALRTKREEGRQEEMEASYRDTCQNMTMREMRANAWISNRRLMLSSFRAGEYRLAHLQRVNKPMREVPVTHIIHWVESIFPPLYENEVGKQQCNSGAVERMTERKTKAQKKRRDGLKGS